MWGKVSQFVKVLKDFAVPPFAPFLSLLISSCRATGGKPPWRPVSVSVDQFLWGFGGQAPLAPRFCLY